MLSGVSWLSNEPPGSIFETLGWLWDPFWKLPGLVLQCFCYWWKVQSLIDWSVALLMVVLGKQIRILSGVGAINAFFNSILQAFLGSFSRLAGGRHGLPLHAIGPLGFFTYVVVASLSVRRSVRSTSAASRRDAVRAGH